MHALFPAAPVLHSIYKVRTGKASWDFCLATTVFLLGRNCAGGCATEKGRQGKVPQRLGSVPAGTSTMLWPSTWSQEAWATARVTCRALHPVLRAGAWEALGVDRLVQGGSSRPPWTLKTTKWWWWRSTQRRSDRHPRQQWRCPAAAPLW